MLTRTTTTTTSDHPWDEIFQAVTTAIGRSFRAGIGVLLQETPHRDPFRVLISTIISLRTRDEVTIAASRRLFAHADTPATVLELTRDLLEECLYPAGFYRTKAESITKICRILLEQYAGEVPSTMEELLALPGVGRKTANLVLSAGFGVPAICVDIHVHRISNRCGWVATRAPEQTESALREILPMNYWIPINEWLVGFGQQVCTAASPRCSTCPLSQRCPRIGVSRWR